MKNPFLDLVALTSTAFLCVSLSVGQEQKGRPLEPVDINQVWHSAPGMVPAHTMVYDTLVAGIMSRVDLDSLISFVRILSGEDTVVVGGRKVRIRERSSQAGGDLAASYLKQKLASYNLEVVDQKYSGTGRNIYATQTGHLYPEKQYIICAHYDAVADYCADDNASGVAAVLEAARILSPYTPDYTVVFALWDEEEVGSYGSQYYASQVLSSQQQIQGVLNMDMLGWDGNDDYLADIHTANTVNSTDLANLFVVVDDLYGLPLNPVVYNPGTWQSDHSVFWNYGLGAILLIEAYYGGDLNPYYHGSDDRIAKFSLPYFHAMSRLSIGVLTTLLELTTAPVIASIVPVEGYQTHRADVEIKGMHTHFQDNPAATRVWLSKDDGILSPDSIRIVDNTTIRAHFTIPPTAALGFWDVHVETAVDSILTRIGGFSILPPPAIVVVSPESLSVSVGQGETTRALLTISNTGGSDLCFTARGFGGSAALQFDGVDGMVMAGGVGLPGGNSDRTMELWFRQDSQPGEEGTLVGYGGWGVPDCVYEILLHQSHMSFSQWGGDVSGGSVIQYSQWYHGAVVNHGNDVTLYVNGKLDNNGAQSISTAPTGSLVMGKAPPGYDSIRRLHGAIDEVRIWDYARTQAEIQSAMHRELTDTEPGLVGYWRLNEGAGTTVFDLSANANHGSLTGGATWTDSTAPVRPMWFSVSPDSGVCVPQSSLEIEVTFDATRVEIGSYHSSLRIRTNDPMHEDLIVPVHMEVSSSADAGRDDHLPVAFGLSQNFPNPFNPSTRIEYALPVRSRTTLTIFSVLGERVAELVNGEMEAGYHGVQFDARGLASGVYLYRLQAGDFTQIRRLMLLR